MNSRQINKYTRIVMPLVELKQWLYLANEDKTHKRTYWYYSSAIKWLLVVPRCKKSVKITAKLCSDKTVSDWGSFSVACRQ